MIIPDYGVLLKKLGYSDEEIAEREAQRQARLKETQEAMAAQAPSMPAVAPAGSNGVASGATGRSTGGR